MDIISIEILNEDLLQKQKDDEFSDDLNTEESPRDHENDNKNSDDADAEEDDEQDDLTNLAWLTELRNQRHNSILYGGEYEYETASTIAIGTTQLIDDEYTTTTTTTTIQNDMPKILHKAQQNTIDGKPQQQQQQTQKTPIRRPTPMERFETFCKKVKRDLAEYEKCSIDYQTIEADKPPFNYSHIIGMVMLEKGRVTLQQICAWIELKFAYFRTRKKWNNSIRHNLSLHPCFRKIDRKKYEKGKGGYWELGIDLKKCERKRIRHRKNVQKQQKMHQIQKQQYNNIHEENLNKDLEFELELDDELNEDDINNKSQQKQQQQQLNTNDTEFLLDDEFDVQQNIDITSCCHKQQQQQHNIQFLEQQQQQQFQLGTIIISGGASPTNCSPFITTTTTTEGGQDTNWQNFYDVTETITGAHKNKQNVIVEEIQQQQQQQNHQRPLLLANLLTTERDTSEMLNHQFDENIVTTICSNNNETSFFQPTSTATEIDSIEEAFQYLRSLDTNNRDESFLDNFFDVSVSDF